MWSLTRRVLLRMACLFMRLFYCFRPVYLFDLCLCKSNHGPKYPVQKGMQEDTSFVAVMSATELAHLWFRFDFGRDLAVLVRMIERFGMDAVLRTADSTGKTVSHWIAIRGNRTALNYIAEIDPSIVIQQWKEDHIQPLVHLAFNNNNIDILDALVEVYGLDLNFRNEFGQNAMMQAVISIYNLLGAVKSYHIILRCAIYGIDVNSTNPDTQQTALHYAVQRFNLQDVHLLLQLGANPNVKDRWDQTPYDYAVQNGNKQMASLLCPEVAQLEPKLSIKQKLSSYIDMIKGSTMVRNRMIMKWSGAFFSIFHLAFFACYLLPVYFWYYMGRTWDLLPIHVILCGCLILAAISGFTTAFANLCFIPTGSSDYYQLMNYLHGDGKELASKRCKMLNQFLDEHSARLCHICRCIGPENSKHCYLCQRCCHSWDHHCIFLHACIGGGNFGLFIAFTMLLGLCGGLGLLIVGYSVTLQYREFEHEPFSVWYKLYMALFFFNGWNMLVCFKFSLAGFAMAIASLIKRRRQLRSQRSSNCKSVSLSWDKLI